MAFERGTDTSPIETRGATGKMSSEERLFSTEILERVYPLAPNCIQAWDKDHGCCV